MNPCMHVSISSPDQSFSAMGLSARLGLSPHLLTGRCRRASLSALTDSGLPKRSTGRAVSSQARHSTVLKEDHAALRMLLARSQFQHACGEE